MEGREGGREGGREEKHNTKLRERKCGQMETDCKAWQPDNTHIVGTSSKKWKRARKKTVHLTVA